MGDRGGCSFGVRKRGWVPASARTTGGGTVNLPRLYGGGLCAGKTGEWGVADDRGGRSFGVRRRGCHVLRTGGGMVNLPCLHGGSLWAGRTGEWGAGRSRGTLLRGTEEGMGDCEGRPYGGRKGGLVDCIREDNGGWDGYSSMSSRGQALRRERTDELVCGGWAIAGDAPTGYGRGDGSPHLREDNGRGWIPYPPSEGGMGPRIREDNGGGTGFRMRGNGGGGGGLGEGPAAGEDFGGRAFQEDFAVTVPVDG